MGDLRDWDDLEACFGYFSARLRRPSRETANIMDTARQIRWALRVQARATGGFFMGSVEDKTGVRGFSDVDYAVQFQLLHRRNSIAVSRRLKTVLGWVAPYATSVELDPPGVTVQFGPAPWHRIEFIPIDSNTKSGRTAGTLLQSVWHGRIADGSGGWRPTSPEAYADLAAQANRDHARPGTAVVLRFRDRSGRFVEKRGQDSGTVLQSIKVLKAWKYRQRVPILSLYLLLSTVAEANRQQGTLPIHETVVRVLRRMSNGGLAAVDDPANEGNRIEACAPAYLPQAREAVAEALHHAEAAVEYAASGRHAVDLSHWRRLFGARFPEWPTDETLFPEPRYQPFTREEAEHWFASEDAARVYLENLRWGTRRHVVCPTCGSFALRYGRGSWQCLRAARHCFDVLCGSSLERSTSYSRTLLDLWRDADDDDAGKRWFTAVQEGIQSK